MDFEIPEELKMVQSLVRDFVRDQVKPLERDIMGRAAGLADARACLPPEEEDRLMKMAQDIGLWGPGVPEELGGMGLGVLGNCLAEEEIAQTIVPFTFGDVTPILFECNPEQRERYFVPHFQRRRQAHLALMEPQDRTGFPRLQTTAARSGSDYVITGTKMSFSRPGRDCFAIVFAADRVGSGPEAADGPASGGGPGTASGPASGGGPGATCFLVDAGTPGFTVAGSAGRWSPGGAEAAGWRTQVRAPLTLSFAGCRVPEANILGARGQAFRLGRRWLPSRRLVRGARCVGVGQRLLEEARAHVESWQSFGQPLHRRPGVEAALADIAVSIHAGRLLVHEAACKADAADPAAAGSGADGDQAGAGSIRREAAMVKLYATQMIRTVADRVSHIYSGPPYVQGLPMQRLCSDALATSAVDLALELQSSIIAGDIMKGLRI